MPRKTSQKAKKDNAEEKSEEVAPRRSGRAITKPETSTASVKDASRSRRSSTAAQTVASVADSKSPRARSNRRESTSPSDSRRNGLESPATRVKATRRSTGRINYKESDGEEETPTPKYDENFESGDEFDDSDSDEKSKPLGRGRQSKVSPKESKSPKKGTRGRRGRPSKKKVEEIKTLEISDDSMEPEIVETKPAPTKSEEQESTSKRSSRGRKPKTEVVDVESEVKTKPSRRSARSTSNKEETPKKRPSRSVQAKRYTEDDEEDIEEIGNSKAEEDTDGTRKRKRESSPEEANKRAREEETKTEEEKETVKSVEEKVISDKQAEEPMDIDDNDSGVVSQDDTNSQEKEAFVDDKDKLKNESKTESLTGTKNATNREESSVKTVEATPVETKQEIKQSVASDSNVSEEMKEDKKEDSPSKAISEKEPENTVAASVPDPTSDKPQPMDCVSSETEKVQNCNTVPEENLESSKLDTDKGDSKASETHANDTKESKNCESKAEPSALNASAENKVPATNTHSAADSLESLNGPEKLTNSVVPTAVLESPKKNLEQSDNAALKANGAHEEHETANSVKEQYVLPGRKYVCNPKLNENILQSVKNKTFGFLSYNLGSEFTVQKEKLLHEFSKLDSHIICLQQVSKPFYSSVLEPSLDAQGYKGVFLQPEDSVRGMATFYKSSQFLLNEQVEISLRQLIDKELEISALEPSSKTAVKSYIKRFGNALLIHFASVVGNQTLNVLNVQIPQSDLSAHALQVSTLAREVIKINGGSNRPLLIGGEFNISENDASYQLLRDGYLSNDMIDELQKRKDIAVPEKDNSSLVDLLWKSFQHPSSNLCSCYSSVLDHELLIPELKRTSSDLLWYSSDSLHTVGVVDVDSNKLGDHRVSLKADVAFSV